MGTIEQLRRQAPLGVKAILATVEALTKSSPGECPCCYVKNKLVFGREKVLKHEVECDALLMKFKPDSDLGTQIIALLTEEQSRTLIIVYAGATVEFLLPCTIRVSPMKY